MFVFLNYYKFFLMSLELSVSCKLRLITKYFSVLLCDSCNIYSWGLKVVDIADGFAHLMDDDGNLREDLKLPENETGTEIQNKFDNDEQFLVRLIKSPPERIICLQQICEP